MKIQRHVRQDFQPVYLKIETMAELETLFAIITYADPSQHGEPACGQMINNIAPELAAIIEAGGII